MAVIFVYALFAASCIGAFYRPFYGVAGYLAFVSLCPQWSWRYTLPDPDFAFQKYISVATLTSYTLSGFKGQRLVGKARQAALCGLGFLLLCFVSSFQSIKPEASSFYISTMGKIFLMLYVGIKLIDDERKAMIAAWVILAGVGWNAWYLNADFLSRGYSLVNLPGNEYAFMNANGYAFVLMVVAILGVAVGVLEQRIPRSLAALAVSLLCIHAIYILESRGCMIGLLLSAAIFCWYLPKTHSAMMRVGIAAALALAIAGPSVVKEFMSSFEAERDTSAESRFYLWDAGARITFDYPLLGVGPWAGEWIVPAYYHFGQDVLLLPNKALHNLTLEIATGCGIPAMLAYFGLFFLPLLPLRKAVVRPETRNVHRIIGLAGLATIPGYWLASQFNSGALIEVPYLILGLTLAVANQCTMVAADVASASTATIGSPSYAGSEAQYRRTTSG
ncbi:O-antigen ligase family protein (plasmid) [Tundrisphaera lichenicola]|uniref:O-antigen ligase family protein n=1 Tax=Tundrisphaera lichenicola TaxID=2029860 RepID=UPI003EC0F88F